MFVIRFKPYMLYMSINQSGINSLFNTNFLIARAEHNVDPGGKDSVKFQIT